MSDPVARPGGLEEEVAALRREVATLRAEADVARDRLDRLEAWVEAPVPPSRGPGAGPKRPAHPAITEGLFAPYPSRSVRAGGVIAVVVIFVIAMIALPLVIR